MRIFGEVLRSSCIPAPDHTARGKPDAVSPPFGGPHFFFLLPEALRFSFVVAHTFKLTCLTDRV